MYGTADIKTVAIGILSNMDLKIVLSLAFKL